MKTLLLLACLSQLSCAIPTTFAWDKPANPVALTHLREKLDDGSTRFLGSVSEGETMTVDLEAGMRVIVATSMNAHGWSSFSDPLTVTIEDSKDTKPVSYTAFKIEYGDDLTGWETKMFFVQDKARLFARVKVTPVQVYLTPENP